MSASPAILIIGGGAAGFFGAIAAAESCPSAHVTLLEAAREPLGKVRISGGGRCNVTHACFDPAALVQHYPRGGKALRGAFTRFQPRDTVAWFQQRGVMLKTEADGRMFPTTDDSATIVNCLVQAAEAAGVQVKPGAAVTAVVRDGQGFAAQLRAGGTLRGDRLLLATGSSPQGYRIAQSLGHTLEPPVPSLFTFNVPEPALHELAGVSVESAQVTVKCPDQKPLTQTGPLLITHWGLSGPAVLKLSAWGARALHNCGYRAIAQIHWLPNQSPEQIRQSLQQTKTDWGKRAVRSTVPPDFPLPRRLWNYLGDRAQVAPDQRWADLSKPQLHHLRQELTQGQYAIAGKGVFKEEFVTCGGVSLKEVDFKTMASRVCPGLYFAGEILDIDGVTGGFNFQSAWTTGWLAGKAISAGIASQIAPFD
ncbi:NAD(P)/FAD-dependent oxidoreductase [Thermoleptolyngbya sichuanensis A183]|uniref:NAD(P)/FAD-dependent oxidoreductase n=1 Tax=Thermoleptolyngbya sichuanensis A183 TaxID=2737172 RepID=A0A6M8BF45_9CYAN|nr:MULTISPECIES: NAD(P)/FAD-dependent oxidoreductase [Thermoleptolyngbya]QKD84832.1 NAD(P)/FAD-dependent oxidoreductase [Thermoleptolyngbya sichuanensis A183]